ncbi:MAG TPA: hypothetical protein VGD02_00295 [Gemmatimonadaceae bacterium]
MTVGLFSTRLWAVISSSRPRCRNILRALLISSLAFSGVVAQTVTPDAAPTESRQRSENDDAVRVYRTVFDRLYSFYGEIPRRLVVLDRHATSDETVPSHRSTIDASTLASYATATLIGDSIPRFRYRIPITWITNAGLKRIARAGSPLAKMAAARFEAEQSPLWYGFRARYPGAWGYLAVGRVAFNRAHSEALVFTRHFCGTMCVNADTWFLERHGNEWTIVERIPRESATNWSLDGTRYLGPEAKPNWYRPRRVHGVFTSAETGEPLGNLPIQVKYYMSTSQYLTDRLGRYSITNLPLTSISLMARCPTRLGGKWLVVRPIAVTPGLDLIFNPRIDFADCQE